MQRFATNRSSVTIATNNTNDKTQQQVYRRIQQLTTSSTHSPSHHPNHNTHTQPTMRKIPRRISQSPLLPISRPLSRIRHYPHLTDFCRRATCSIPLIQRRQLRNRPWWRVWNANLTYEYGIWLRLFRMNGFFVRCGAGVGGCGGEGDGFCGRGLAFVGIGEG